MDKNRLEKQDKSLILKDFLREMVDFCPTADAQENYIYVLYLIICMTDVSIIQKLILPLVFFMLVAGVILGADVGDWIIGGIEYIMNFILDHLFGAPDDYQIAKESTVALTCAIDVVSAFSSASPPTVAADGTFFDGIKSCDGKKHKAPTASVIAKISNKGGAITGAVFDVGNKITGGILSPSVAGQCGPMGKDCGRIFKDDCTKDERCVSKWGGWYCVSDPTCMTSIEQVGSMDGDAMCFGSGEHVCTVCNREAPGDDVRCSVIGFQLPQDMDPNFGIYGTVLDFGKRWIGATGQPKYLVYFETFPEYAEAAWMYKNTDVLIHAFAIGAAVNIGFGGLRVGKTFIVNGPKYLIRPAFKKAVAKKLERKVWSTKIKSDMVRAAGGKAAQRSYLVSVLGTDLVGSDANMLLMKHSQKRVLSLLSNTDANHLGFHRESWRKFIGPAEFDDLLNKNADDCATFLSDDFAKSGSRMSDVTGHVFGTGDDMSVDTMKSIAKDRKRDFGLVDVDYDNMVEDINRMRTMRRQGKFMDSSISALFKEEFLENNMKFYETFYKDISKLNSKAFVMNDKKFGIMPAIKWAKRRLFSGSDTKMIEQMDREMDEAAKMIYERWMWEIWNGAGGVSTAQMDQYATKVGTHILADDWYVADNTDNIVKWDVLEMAAEQSDTSSSQMMLDAYTAAWHNMPADTSMKKEVWTRAGKLSRGFAGMPYDGYPDKKRVAVMAAAIGASYVAMQLDSQAEKYKICEGNSMCMAWPKYWYRVGNDPEDNSYEPFKIENLGDRWVQLDIPKVTGSKGFPVALMSPCKANIDVVAANDCSCKKFYSNDEIGVFFKTYTDIDEKDMTTGEVKYKVYEEWTITKKLYVRLPCQKDDDEGCAGLNLQPFDGTIEEYLGDGGPESQMMKDITAIINNPVHCPKLLGLDRYDPDHSWDVGPTVHEDFARGKWRYMYSNVDYTLLNVRTQEVKENVFAESELIPRAHKMCIKYGSLNPLGMTAHGYDCIKLKVDKDSMAGYKDDGFSPNFCRDNKNKWTDKATIGIEAGLLIGGVALALFPPTSPAGAAIVLGACGTVGGTAAVVETYWDITDRWPEDQSG